MFLVAPLVLLSQVHTFAEEHEQVLEAVALLGICGTLALTLLRGTVYPYAHVCLVLITIFVALELGVTLATHSWGLYGLVALGQATTNFCLILALLQFDHDWFDSTAAASLCLLQSAI